MTAQDSQSELDKLIESWIPINVKDKDFVKEAKMKGRKDFKEAIEAYVTTRIKEAERLVRLDLKQTVIDADNTYTNEHDRKLWNHFKQTILGEGNE